MSADAVVLSESEQQLVGDAFGTLIQEREWCAWAATVQPTHVHVVFEPMRDEIKNVIATMKYRAARDVLAVRRKNGNATGRSLWTKRPFPRFLFTRTHVEHAIDYVRQHNLRVGRNADPYTWLAKYDG